MRPRPVVSVSESQMMWCAECQLDAPAVAVPEEPGVIRCAYCRSELAGRRDEEEGPEAGIREPEPEVTGRETGGREQETDDALAAESSLPLLAFVPPPAVDDWEADGELRRVDRLIRVVRHSQLSDQSSPVPSAECGVRLAESTPHSAFRTPHSDASNLPARAEKTSLAAWACLTLGLMAFVCGGVLVGWSFIADRGDLWSLGLPLTLGGQVGLVLGLLLQLDGLSQSTRRTEQTLTDLDGQLGQLREVTALVSATHSAPAHSFYAHLNAGASPQILLADLKGQLDLLAQQMARQRKAA
jgi:hypothetical protein